MARDDTSEMVQILDREGSLVGDPPPLPDKELLEMYRLMVLSREFDRRTTALQRQGRVGTYPMLEGEEATQIGSAMALASEDWVFPSYREHGVELARGMPAEVILSYWRGLPTTEWDPYRFQVMTQTVPIASQLPHAVGFARVQQQLQTGAVAIAYFGDGATSETDFHSALNFAGVWKTPNVFLCANNQYAISVPVSQQTASDTIAAKSVAYGMPGIRVDGMDVLAVYTATSAALARARGGGGPTLIEAVTYRFGAHATADDARRYRAENEELAWKQKDPIPRFRTFLEQRGLWNPAIDAEIAADAETSVERAIVSLESQPMPGRDSVIRHAYRRIPSILVKELHATQKAHEEPETEFAPDELWHVGVDELPDGPATERTMAGAINNALEQALEADTTIVLLGEDIGVAGGVFRITDKLQSRFGPERVMDTPLNESGIVGTAIGMAIAGARPVAEIQFDGFVYPAMDQIVSHVGRMPYRSRGNVKLPMVIRWPNGAGIGAHENHCDSPEALFVHTPGLTVVVPSTPIDAKGLLTAAIRSDDPVLFLEPKVLYRSIKEQVPDEAYELPIGRARIRRPGSDLTIVTYGGMVPVCLAAADSAVDAGISTEVIDLRTLFPWDTDTVAESVARTGRLIAVQEPPRTAGMAAEVAAWVGENLGWSLLSPVRRVSGIDAPWPQFAIERHSLVDEAMVLDAIRASVAG